MPIQLTFPHINIRVNQIGKVPKCPYCKRTVNVGAALHCFEEYKSWLVQNKALASNLLFNSQLYDPTPLSLSNHPDLLWALKAEAKFNDLEPNDMLAQIVDSYFDGKFRLVHRRKLQYILEPDQN